MAGPREKELVSLPGQSVTQQLPDGNRCPRCGRGASTATDVNPERDAALEPGDFAVCLNCAEILRLTEGYGLRRLAPGEFEALPPKAQGELVRTQLRVRAYRNTFARN